MTTAQQDTSGEGLASKLTIVLLLALAIGLYLRIVMVDGEPHGGEPPPQASVQVVEGEPVVSRQAATKAEKELPEEQMSLIKQVFAPESLNN